MRATSMVGLALVCVLASACGRTAPDTATSEGDRVLAPFSVQPAQTSPTAPVARQQPRLATLIPKAPVPPKPPMASYSRYNGRGPSDAVIPRGVNTRAQDRDIAAETRAALSRTLPQQEAVPTRDVVDMGLSPVQREARARPTPRVKAPVAISKAPAPTPRPVTLTQRPQPRPSAEVAVAVPATPKPPQQPTLPPSPRIASLSAPSLSAPAAIRDATPTGLPSAPSAEVAVPLGRVPASLGLANLRATEAAIPVADSLEQSAADPSGALGWDQAAALIRAGEVQSVDDIGEFEILLTLCSGRGVISIVPTPDALETLQKPKVICGKTASLTSQ